MFKITKIQRLILAGILLVSSFLLQRALTSAPLTVVSPAVATLLAGTPIFRNAFWAFKYKIVGIVALVTIAVSGCSLGNIGKRPR